MISPALPWEMTIAAFLNVCWLWLHILKYCACVFHEHPNLCVGAMSLEENTINPPQKKDRFCAPDQWWRLYSQSKASPAHFCLQSQRWRASPRSSPPWPSSSSSPTPRWPPPTSNARLAPPSCRSNRVWFLPYKVFFKKKSLFSACPSGVEVCLHITTYDQQGGRDFFLIFIIFLFPPLKKQPHFKSSLSFLLLKFNFVVFFFRPGRHKDSKHA